VIRYTEDMTAITEGMLTGFFVGWPDEPLLPYYAKLGMTAIPGAGLRNPSALRSPAA
jgi:hypothetical protein